MNPCPRHASRAIGLAGVINIDGALRAGREGGADNDRRIIHLVEQAQANKMAPSSNAQPLKYAGRHGHCGPYGDRTAALPRCRLADMGVPRAGAAAYRLPVCAGAFTPLRWPRLAAGTRSGLLVKGGRARNDRAGLAVAFDKTGTLTAGPGLPTSSLDTQTEHDILALAASVAPRRPSWRTRSWSRGGPGIDARGTESERRGRCCCSCARMGTLAIGSPAYAGRSVNFTVEQGERIEALQRDGKTVTVLFDEQAGTALGLLALRDEPRPDAKAAVARLKAMGVRPVMLTGDHALAGQAIAAGLGLECVAQLLRTNSALSRS